jgi:hypothetical protein
VVLAIFLSGGVVVDLKELSPAALSAAMRGGTASWGQYANSRLHIRYAEPQEKSYRRRCLCGCKKRATHRGMANGIAMMDGCEMAVARWVRTGTF